MAYLATKTLPGHWRLYKSFSEKANEHVSQNANYPFKYCKPPEEPEGSEM